MNSFRLFVPNVLMSVQSSVLLGRCFTSEHQVTHPPDGHGRTVLAPVHPPQRASAKRSLLTVFIVAAVPANDLKNVSNFFLHLTDELQVVGIFNKADRRPAQELIPPETGSTIFVNLYQTREGNIEISEFQCFGRRVDPDRWCDVMLFNPEDFNSLSLDLIRDIHQEETCEEHEVNAVTCNELLWQIYLLHDAVRRCHSELLLNFATNFFHFRVNSVCVLFTSIMCCVVYSVSNMLGIILSNSGLVTILKLAAPYFNLANQSQMRFKQLEPLKDITSTRKSIMHWNALLTVVFDFIFGIVITCVLHRFFTAETLLDTFLENTEVIVNQLKKLLTWMMGSPAGLKLNYPLNYSLGTFFLFHIYLWQEYLEVIKPLLNIVLHTAFYTGVLGLTFQLSLLQDLLALATFHIYCFYAYAAKIYGLHVAGLASLWRLFRGKKWNPLRQRVDSCSYDVNQLFMGTLLFTILFFLFPTTSVYYVVFTVLRLVVLAIQGLIHKLITVINCMPLFTLLLYLIHSKQLINGITVNLKPRESSEDGPLIFIIKGAVCSWEKAVAAFSPPTHDTTEGLTWKSFIGNLLVGRLIYPI